MKKRLLSIVLALALCAGLTVPAFAAADQYKLAVSVPNEAYLSPITTSFQRRDFASNGNYNYTYNSEVKKTNPFSICALPLDSSITINGLRREMRENGMPMDLVVFYVWSDPDNDGIYEQRLFSKRGTEYSVVPLTEKGPFISNDKVTYTVFQAPNFLGIKPTLDTNTYSITCTTNQIYNLFGANTLIQIEVLETENYETLEYWLVLFTGEPASTSTFIDVPAGIWYESSVSWAVEKEIVNGTSANTFTPNRDCTHGEILTLLWRAAGKPESKAEAPIPLKDSDWYAGAVRWAAEKGMIGNGFDLNKPCTRAEAVNYIWQAFNKPNAAASHFTDVPAQADYAGAVSWAVEKGVVKGTSATTFTPDKVCSRAEIVTLLYRAYQ